LILAACPARNSLSIFLSSSRIPRAARRVAPRGHTALGAEVFGLDRFGARLRQARRQRDDVRVRHTAIRRILETAAGTAGGGIARSS
jgi:hypothetical protein